MTRNLAIRLIALTCAIVAPETRGRADEPRAPDASESVLVRAMKDELTRSLEKLRIESMANPYYIAYIVDDVEGVRFTASYGALVERGGACQRS
jgi:hypothetical protein